MSKKKDPKKLIVFLILVISYFFYNNFTPNTENFGTSVNKGSDTTSASLTVSFVDVGQADCTLIENDGKYALIDAGNNEDGPLLVKYFESLGIKEFECVFATHAHEDHIGGMDDIINNFKIKNFYMPDAITTTKTFEDVLTALENNKVTFKTPTTGETFKLQAEVPATFTALSVNSDESNLNDTSIVLKLKYNTTTFLFMGDASSKIENTILDKSIQSDVLKVGHHGSKTSTSNRFLEKVNPKYAVISVGKGNSYSHPNIETLNRLAKKDVKVYRTDEFGTIIAKSNGTIINFENVKTNTNG